MHQRLIASQVILGFVLTASLTLISAIFALTLDLTEYVEESPPLSPFDSFLRLLYRCLPWKLNRLRRKIAKKVLQSFVLSLSDQQLITGIAILSAGWIRHREEKLYHFAMIMDLAWMSSNAHLLSLELLREHFAKHHQTPYWRVTLMGCNFVMLFVANFYSGVATWYDDFAYPAQCNIDAVNDDPSVIGGESARYTYATMVLLVHGYIRAVVVLFPSLLQPLAAYYRDSILQRLDRYFDRGIRCHSKMSQSHQSLVVDIKRMLLGLILGLYELSYTTIDRGFYIVRSSAWSVLVIDTFWFAYGNWIIWVDRAYARENMEGDEDKWGFGQLLPLLLIGLPLLSITDSYYRECQYLHEGSKANGQYHRDPMQSSENH